MMPRPRWATLLQRAGLFLALYTASACVSTGSSSGAPGLGAQPAAPAAPTGAPPAFLRVHLDQVKPGSLAQVMGTRAEYRGWVVQHAANPGETPAAFLRVGDDRVWALRPAAKWEEIPAQVSRDAEVERRVRAAVGEQLDDNGRRMHGGIVEHHNELLRYQAEVSRPPGSGRLLEGVGWVVIDAVRPDNDESYEAQLKAAAASRTGWWLVYFSSPGSGAYVHFSSAPPVLPDEALTRSRLVLPAQALPELSSGE